MQLTCRGGRPGKRACKEKETPGKGGSVAPPGYRPKLGLCLETAVPLASKVAHLPGSRVHWRAEFCWDYSEEPRSTAGVARGPSFAWIPSLKQKECPSLVLLLSEGASRRLSQERVIHKKLQEAVFHGQSLVPLAQLLVSAQTALINVVNWRLKFPVLGTSTPSSPACELPGGLLLVPVGKRMVDRVSRSLHSLPGDALKLPAYRWGPPAA